MSMLVDAYRSAAVAVTTWNPSDLSGDFVLTGANLIATKVGASNAYGIVRATVGQNTGKLYFEATFTGTGQMAIGLADASVAVTSLLAVAHTIGFWGHDKDLRIGGTTVYAIGGSLATGSVVRIAADFTNNKIWAGRVGDVWNTSGTDDPATNTGGYSMAGAGFSGVVYPAASANPTTVSLTLNCGQSAFAGAIPSGFSQWG